VEFGTRHAGERHASENFNDPEFSDDTVLDLGAAYRRGPIEVGLAVENLTDTEWRSSEFFFASCALGEVSADPLSSRRGRRSGHRRLPRHARKPAQRAGLSSGDLLRVWRADPRGLAVG
jgi:hypothetical protein